MGVPDKPSSVSLPIGHPLSFARFHLEDPYLVEAVKLYRRLEEEKVRLMGSGKIGAEWQTLLQMKQLQAEVQAYCDKTYRQPRRSGD